MDSIIFDLDGTLWDPREVVVDIWNDILQKNDIPQEVTAADLKSVMGLQQKEIGEKLFPDLAAEQRQSVLTQCSLAEAEQLSVAGGKLYNNVERVLEKLAGTYKLFIVSNCQEGYIESFYEYHQLDKYFQDFENPGRTGLSKGENIQLIIERNNLQSPVYVGDTEGDYKATQMAGIPFVHAAYGFGEVSKPDHVIREFDDLLELFG